MKKRITRKMRRELKNAVYPLEELLIIIKQYFPKLTNWIDNLTDTRHQSYVKFERKGKDRKQVSVYESRA